MKLQKQKSSRKERALEARHAEAISTDWLHHVVYYVHLCIVRLRGVWFSALYLLLGRAASCHLDTPYD